MECFIFWFVGCILSIIMSVIYSRAIYKKSGIVLSIPFFLFLSMFSYAAFITLIIFFIVDIVKPELEKNLPKWLMRLFYGE